MNMNSSHYQAVTIFTQILYMGGTPVLFIKDAKSKVRIGREFPKKHLLNTLYCLLQGEYVADFLRLITQNTQYSALVQALGRKPEASDIRCAFRPLESELNGFFVDDAKPKYQQEYGHVWVETSPGNWQAHFMTDRIMTASEALSLQRMFCTLLDGDSSAVAGTQARRFPVQGLNVIINGNQPCYKVANLLSRMKAQQAAELIVDCANGYEHHLKPSPTSWDLEKAKKYWIIYITDQARAAGDASRADMYLVNRLVADGVDEKTIHDLLRHVSMDIEARKAGHVSDYIARTIKKAMSRSRL